MARLLLFGKALILALLATSVVLLWPVILFILSVALLVTIFYQQSLYEAKLKEENDKKE